MLQIDIRKMPLGKLSHTQIHEAYAVLRDLSRLLEGKKSIMGDVDKSRLIGDTTRFYTLIPHDFGLKAPPLLDNLAAIKTKSRMCEELLELEVACSIMKCDGGKVNPLDEQYAKMHNTIRASSSSTSFISQPTYPPPPPPLPTWILATLLLVVYNI